MYMVVMKNPCVRFNFSDFTTYRDSISAIFRPIGAVLEEIWPIFCLLHKILGSGVLFDGEFVGSVVRVNRGAPGEIWPIRHIKIKPEGKNHFSS